MLTETITPFHMFDWVLNTSLRLALHHVLFSETRLVEVMEFLCFNVYYYRSIAGPEFPYIKGGKNLIIFTYLVLSTAFMTF